MRSKVAERMMAKMPKDIQIFTDKFVADLTVLINQILEEKKVTQKELADKLNKRPSEVSKWLHGEHNFTLRSIAKLEAELGETLLEVPVRKRNTVFEPVIKGNTSNVYSVIQQIHPSEAKIVPFYQHKSKLNLNVKTGS